MLRHRALAATILSEPTLEDAICHTVAHRLQPSVDTGLLVMLDPATGREIWRVTRSERFNWAAPYVATHNGRRQIIMSGETVRGYEWTIPTASP